MFGILNFGHCDLFDICDLEFLYLKYFITLKLVAIFTANFLLLPPLWGNFMTLDNEQNALCPLSSVL